MLSILVFLYFLFSIALPIGPANGLEAEHFKTGPFKKQGKWIAREFTQNTFGKPKHFDYT